MLTSIMPERLNRIISNYIKKDQAGFIRGRLMKDNFRKLMDIVELLQRKNSSSVIAFLDMGKAVDLIVWIYLKQVLDQFGIGTYMENWVEHIQRSERTSGDGRV